VRMKRNVTIQPNLVAWLNLAEIEPQVLARQCLDRRIPDFDALAREISAWSQPRNALGAHIRWRFTTADARIKLRQLYPSIHDRQRTSLSSVAGAPTGRLFPRERKISYVSHTDLR
jgi:hypothetical protein